MRRAILKKKKTKHTYKVHTDYVVTLNFIQVSTTHFLSLSYPQLN